MIELKPIRNVLDKLKPKFANNKFAHTVFDGLETFLYQPNHTTKLGTHIKDGMDLKRTMFHVVIALQLCYALGTFNIGHQHYVSLGLYPELLDGLGWKMLYGLGQLLPLFIVVHVVGLGIEFFYAARKGHAIEEGFLVSGALIPLIMPPDIPLWMVAVATAFAVIIVKEAFGGTGMNIWNVALMSRVFIFFAYPIDISGDFCWVAYDYNFIHSIFGLQAHTESLLGGADAYAALFTAEGVFQSPVQGWSGATPLALAAKEGWAGVQAAAYTIDGVTYQQYSFTNLFFGFIPGSIGEMTKIGIIFGMIVLLGSGIGSWRIMVSMILGCALMGILLNVLGHAYPDAYFINVPWYNHFLMGSFLFACVYMATDPVTAASTPTGKLVYGFLIGAVGLIIRVLNPAYPEGWMLAILFMNTFAPLIDDIVLQGNIKRRLARVTE